MSRTTRPSNPSIQAAWQTANRRAGEGEQVTFTQVARKAMEVESLAAIYTLTDKVLTKSAPTVHLVRDQGMTVPAMNDGKDIFININGYGATVANMDIATLHGLNYHEVAHLLYSPRVGSEFGRWVSENQKLLRAFNILEDARIEVLLTHKYPAVLPFITNTVLKSISKNIIAEQFIIARGRRYLPLEVRQTFADMAVAKFGLTKTTALAALIDEYRLLNIYFHPDRAKQIITDFSALIDDMQTPATPNGCHSEQRDQWGRYQNPARQVMKAGRTETPKNIQDLLNEITGKDEQADVIEEQADAQGDSEGEGQSQGQGDSEGEGQGEGGAGGDGDSEDSKSRASRIVSASLEQASNDERVTNEVTRVVKAVRESQAKKATTSISRSGAAFAPISSTARTTAVQFARELERMQSETDPAWVMEQPSGRLNVQRFMRRDPNALTKVFDRWSEGNFTHEIEAVILTDSSGSMGYVMDTANEAAWIIKRALESIDGSVTAYAFGNNSKLVYSANERTNASKYRNVPSAGGTDPMDSLLAAQQIMLASNKTTKLLFMVTDGMWGNGRLADQILREMEAEGVVTILIYLGNSREPNPLIFNGVAYEGLTADNKQRIYDYNMKQLFHNAQIKSFITNPKDIVQVARDVAKRQIKAAA